ncbi:MAG: CocE/NonD family hydrolase [Alphaproteobacteria bacterium]|nr:CocE/NonD family hydrolase [Alphaproteobacteria bacterium]
MTMLRESLDDSDVWICMPDGIRLSARVRMPKDADRYPVPAILEYTPYRKSDVTVARDQHHVWLAAHRYAMVRCDIRGHGDSEGLAEDEYSERELNDAGHVIEWLAEQSWCSGAVGMMGISWGGINALQVAAIRPPGLGAIYTACSTDDRYEDDVHYNGGCLTVENLNWGLRMLVYSLRPPNPQVVGERWREMWRQRLEGAREYAAHWTRHQRRDELWRHGSVRDDCEAIDVPVYAVGGWADGYTNSILRLVVDLKVPVRGLIGPWGHCYPWEGKPGPAIDGLHDMLRWWDHWLKGRDSGLMQEPGLHVWMQEPVVQSTTREMQSGRWISEPSWPSPNVIEKDWQISDRMLVERSVEAVRSMSGERGNIELVCRPDPLAGSTHGDRCPDGGKAQFPPDQREEDGRSIVFDSTPLSEPLEILGTPYVDLELRVDQPQAHVYMRLNDVAPDQQSSRVTYGVFNLNHRHGHEVPEPLPVGKRFCARIALNDIAHRFEVGHRIRLTIQSGCWPLYWPSPAVVSVGIVNQTGSLTLPVRPMRAETFDPKFRPAPNFPSGPVSTLAPPRRERRLVRDFVTGEVTYENVRDAGRLRHDKSGFEIVERGEERFTVVETEPAAARAESKWVASMSFGDGTDICVAGECVQTADASDFHIRTHAQVSENGQRVWSRTWDDRIPRDFT